MRHVEFIVEATRYLDSYYFGEKLRKDIEFNEINKEFIENVEDWAEEYDSNESMFDFLDNEFELMEWLKPDFRDRKVIKAVMKDAGYKWSNRYDQILDGKKSGAYILLYHPLEAYESVYDSLLWGVNNEEDFLQSKVNLLRSFEVEGLMSVIVMTIYVEVLTVANHMYCIWFVSSIRRRILCHIKVKKLGCRSNTIGEEN